MTPIYVLIWLLSVIGATYIGGKKGNPLGALFLGCVLGPLGLLIAVLSGNGNRVACPFCAEQILKKAKVCPHCQRDIKL